MKDPETIARRYLAALETFDREAMLALLHEDVEVRLMPNMLAPRGETRALPALVAAFDKGREMLERQTYAIERVLVQDATCALEIAWSGTLKGGKEMRARFAMFLDTRDGKIFRQTNYDCFEPA